MTTAFAPTAADLSEFYFDPVGAAHADDDTPPPPAETAGTAVETAEQA